MTNPGPTDRKPSTPLSTDQAGASHTPDRVQSPLGLPRGGVRPETFMGAGVGNASRREDAYFWPGVFVSVKRHM